MSRACGPWLYLTFGGFDVGKGGSDAGVIFLGVGFGCGCGGAVVDMVPEVNPVSASVGSTFHGTKA